MFDLAPKACPLVVWTVKLYLSVVSAPRFLASKLYLLAPRFSTSKIYHLAPRFLASELYLLVPRFSAWMLYPLVVSAPKVSVSKFCPLTVSAPKPLAKGFAVPMKKDVLGLRCRRCFIGTGVGLARARAGRLIFGFRSRARRRGV